MSVDYADSRPAPDARTGDASGASRASLVAGSTHYHWANALWCARLCDLSGTARDSGQLLGALQRLDGNVLAVQRGEPVAGARAVLVEHAHWLVLVFVDEAAPTRWFAPACMERTAVPMGGVHHGFLHVLARLWAEIERLLAEAREAAGGVHRPLLFTGHGAGGALATLAAARFLDADEPFQNLYTFGAPRCGDRSFARAFDSEAGARTFRFHGEGDTVPRAPPRALQYRHVGQLVYAGYDGTLRHDPSPWFRELDTDRDALARLLEAGVPPEHQASRYLRSITGWGEHLPLP